MLESTLGGLSSGGAYALLGVCVVLVYRTAGTVNFAQAALGAFGAYVMVEAYEAGVPYGPAALLGILSGAAVAGLAGFVIARWFFEATQEIRATVAIALLIGLLTLALRVFGDQVHNLPALANGIAFTFRTAIVTSTAVIAALSAIAAAAAATVFLRRTSTGVRLQAMAERPVTAELLGVPARTLAVGVWAVGGALATFAMLLVAPTRSSGFLSLSVLILPALAAALVGHLRDLRLTVAGGLALGLAEGLLASMGSIANYRPIIPFVVILATLLWSQRRQRFDAPR